MLRTDQIANSPTRGIKILANRANGERQIGNLGRECAYACEWDIVKAIVDLCEWSEYGSLMAGKTGFVPHRRE